MSRTAVGYCRVSTERQASEGVSLEMQQERIWSWCTFQKLEPATIYTDEGLSGGRADNRPSLKVAVERAVKTKGVLIVYSLSRLSRDTLDALTIERRLRKAGAALVSVTESVDTSTSSGRCFFRMLASFAELERDQISERTAAGLGFKRDQYERISGKPPMGWRFEDGRVVEDEPYRARCILARSKRQDGSTYAHIGDCYGVSKSTAKRMVKAAETGFPLESNGW